MLSHTTNFSRTQPLGKNPRFVPSAASHSLNGTLDMMGAPMSFARNSEIYGENEPAEFLYKLVSGAVRTSKILNDGRRQIGEFYLPGDIFGLEVGTEHAFSAEAIADAKVIVIKRSAVEALAARDNDVARQLWATTGRELQRMQEHILLLIKTAQERVAGFLLEMAERIKSTTEVELADVAAGHRRLSRPDDRNRFPHADHSRKQRGDRAAKLAPDRAPQPAQRCAG